MGRLTKYGEDGWMKLSKQKDEYGNEIKVTIDGALRKLAHYEDMKEQGRLIELPCAVGDKVWMVVDNRELKEHMKGCYPPAEELPDLYISEHDFSLLHLPSMGKRVFLTKEEAEAKLKELE